MFQNSYQSGTHLEIFDPKGQIYSSIRETVNLHNKEKQKHYHNLHKINIPHNVQRIFDKELKGYIFELQGHVTKIQFPRTGDLNLVQQYLVVQIFLYVGYQWTMELVVTDTSRTKRRIMLTSAVKQLDSKFFHIKSPIDQIRRGVWLNLQIDVWSFMEAWKDTTFRTLDMIVIGAPCKLRKIYITKNPIEDSELLDLEMKLGFQTIPRAVDFPEGFPHSNQVITFKLLNYNLIDELEGYTEQSNAKPHNAVVKLQNSPPKVQKKLGAYQYQQYVPSQQSAQQRHQRLDQLYQYNYEHFEQENKLNQYDNFTQDQPHTNGTNNDDLEIARLESTEQLKYLQSYSNSAAERQESWSAQLRKRELQNIESSLQPSNRAFDGSHIDKEAGEYVEDYEDEMDQKENQDLNQEYSETDNYQNAASGDVDQSNATGEYLQVVYDPVLNCFYDPQTNQYYELK